MHAAETKTAMEAMDTMHAEETQTAMQAMDTMHATETEAAMETMHAEETQTAMGAMPGMMTMSTGTFMALQHKGAGTAAIVGSEADGYHLELTGFRARRRAGSACRAHVTGTAGQDGDDPARPAPRHPHRHGRRPRLSRYRPAPT